MYKLYMCMFVFQKCVWHGWGSIYGRAPALDHSAHHTLEDALANLALGLAQEKFDVIHDFVHRANVRCNLVH